MYIIELFEWTKTSQNFLNGQILKYLLSQIETINMYFHYSHSQFVAPNSSKLSLVQFSCYHEPDQLCFALGVGGWWLT
jgi:hypothetical protein